MGSTGAGEAVVIIAYDGSPAARRAVVDAAKILGSCLILVASVWEEGLALAGPAMPSPDTMMISTRVDPELSLELDHASHEHAERVSREGAALASSLGLDAQPVALPDEGNVAKTILRLAHERHAAAIVVGSRGLSGLRAKLEGSTSKGLLKHAPCPVVVVHESNEQHDEVNDAP